MRNIFIQTVCNFRETRLKLNALGEIVQNQLQPDLVVDKEIALERCVKGSCKALLKKKKYLPKL